MGLKSQGVKPSMGQSPVVCKKPVHILLDYLQPQLPYLDCFIERGRSKLVVVFWVDCHLHHVMGMALKYLK